MIELSQLAVLQVLVVFCRIGACMMLMPGIGTARVPSHVRLFTSGAIAFALTPLLQVELIGLDLSNAPLALLQLTVAEVAVGLTIGLAARYFILALQAMATAIAASIGFSGPSGAAVEEAESVPALASMITLTAILLMFVTGQHGEILRGVIKSYAVLPLASPFIIEPSLLHLTSALAVAFHLGLQLSGPFLMYAILINLLFGLANKLTPTIPVYFISLPFVVAGGLLLLNLTVAELLRRFSEGFSIWLQRG